MCNVASRRWWAILPVAVMGVASNTASAQPIDHDPDHVIVEFRERTRMGAVDSLLGGNGFTAVQSLRDSTTFLVHMPHGWTIETAVENISHRDAVAYAGPNYYCRLPESSQLSQAFLDASPDPFTPGVSPDEFYVQSAVLRMQVSSGHQITTGAGQVIASVDNGVDFSHSLLADRLLATGYDFADNDSIPSYDSGDYCGHGTFSAGLLALSAPDAQILPIRVLDGDGRGTVFDVVQGLDHAILSGASVICMGFSLPMDDHVVSAAVTRIKAAGITAVAPAGNDDSAVPYYPAAYESVVGVGAVDSLDKRAEFSNFGPSVDMCAPGVELYSALPGDNAWGTWSGTSFSAPLVAGMAALVRALHSAAPPECFERILIWATEPIDSLNPLYAGALGTGRANFAHATGADLQVVALWGTAVDTFGVGHEGVAVHVVRDGLAQPNSETITDSLGRYVTAVFGGSADLVFTPPLESGHGITERASVPLSADTMISVVLTSARRGDLNNDGVCDVLDVLAIIDIAFRGAPPVSPEFIADVSCDAIVDIIDVVSLIGHAFRGAPQSWCP